MEDFGIKYIQHAIIRPGMSTYERDSKRFFDYLHTAGARRLPVKARPDSDADTENLHHCSSL